MKKDTNVSIGDRIKQLREPLGLSQVQLADSISVSKQTLYEYSKWDNFKKVIDKAKEACLGSNNNVSDHFANVGKTINHFRDIKKMIHVVISKMETTTQ